MSFWGDYFEAIAPEENRLVALVAGTRTFGQTIRGSAAVGALLAAGVTVTDLAKIDWTVLGFGASSIVLTATIAGADAYFNVLANGLSKRYTKAVVQTIQASGSAPTSELGDAVVDAAAALDKAR